MEDSTIREKVLKKIRAALLNKSADPYPQLDLTSSVHKHETEDPVIIFAEHFIAAGGKFILCENELEFVEGLLNLAEQYKWTTVLCCEDGLSNLLTECEFPHQFEVGEPLPDASVTSCECMIANNGSIVISSRKNGLTTPIVAPVHIVCAKSSQIAMEIKDGLHWMKKQYDNLPSAISFITGPARTQQIDGVFVNEGYGPKHIYLFLVDDKERGFIEAAPDDADAMTNG
ncbi:MAG: LUD domain-containing protein [Bacteroidota bacterium]